MPCCHAGTSDETTSHHATPPATTLHVTPPPRRREQAPARSPHPKCGMVLMGAHRRVINLRLKGNGMFWREAHAEEMLQVRAQVLTGRWDERMTAKRRHLRYDGRLDWRWDPQPMSSKT